MAYEEDFIAAKSTKTEIDFSQEGVDDEEEDEEESQDLREFEIKLITGQEKDKLLNQYVSINENENVEIDVAKKNTLWLRECVLDAPYDKDGVEFKQLSKDDRLSLLQRLKPRKRDKLLDEIFSLNGVSQETKKK